jgi:arginyl-tRNA synthetase
MKNTVEQLTKQAFEALQQAGVIPHEVTVDIKIERSKDASHGDFATNVALKLPAQGLSIFSCVRPSVRKLSRM